MPNFYLKPIQWKSHLDHSTIFLTSFCLQNYSTATKKKSMIRHYNQSGLWDNICFFTRTHKLLLLHYIGDGNFCSVRDSVFFEFCKQNEERTLSLWNKYQRPDKTFQIFQLHLWYVDNHFWNTHLTTLRRKEILAILKIFLTRRFLDSL